MIDNKGKKMDKKFIISLIGAPASGKGYIASCLADELKNKYGLKDEEIVDLSTGELIRREKKENTPLGQLLAANMKEGGLAPDSIINKMFINELRRIKARVLILDGYPRTVGQVRLFGRLMKWFGSAVIFRDTPKELILERVKNRRICANCGKAQEVGNGKCIYCGGELIKRKDDAVLPDRLEEYEIMTKPAVLELKKHDNFFEYEGTAEGEDIARDFLEKNKKYFDC